MHPFVFAHPLHPYSFVLKRTCVLDAMLPAAMATLDWSASAAAMGTLSGAARAAAMGAITSGVGGVAGRASDACRKRGPGST
jgi:hypothetical protein